MEETGANLQTKRLFSSRTKGIGSRIFSKGCVVATGEAMDISEIKWPAGRKRGRYSVVVNRIEQPKRSAVFELISPQISRPTQAEICPLKLRSKSP